MATDTHSAEGHGDSGINAYLVIFAALSIFTIISFVVNGAVHTGTLTTTAGFAIILGVAVCKATLVGIYFMHLKHDWGKLYFMIVPVFVLGVLLMVVLLPDIVLTWND